jgi:hypothetical protein
MFTVPDKAGDEDPSTGGPALTDDTDDTDTVPVPDPPEISGLSSRLVEEYTSIVVVSWTQSTTATAHVEFSLDGEEVRSTPLRELEAGTHEEMLLGVPYGADVTWRVVAENEGGAAESEEQPATTGELPDGIPLPLLEVSEPASYDPAMGYVLVSVSEGDSYGLGGRWWALLLDRQARVVWAHPSPNSRMIMHPRVGVHEDALLIDHNSYWGSFDGGVNSEILEMKIDGTLLHEWETPGLHHAYTQLPSGNIVYGAYEGAWSYEEQIIVIDVNGDTEVHFDCGDWLDSIGEFGEYCGSNTVTYHEPTDRLMVSWFSFDTIIEIDMATDEVVRWFGHVNGTYDFDPPSSAFWYQHGGYITDAGTLITSTHVTADNTELVVREYEIDDANETLHQIWTVGQGEELTGNEMGEAHRLPGGNTLHNFGTNAHLREYAPDGTVTWEIDWEIEQTVGRSAPVLVDLWSFAPERL